MRYIKFIARYISLLVLQVQTKLVWIMRDISENDN